MVEVGVLVDRERLYYGLGAGSLWRWLSSDLTPPGLEGLESLKTRITEGLEGKLRELRAERAALDERRKA
jgi:hypothetical protein